MNEDGLRIALLLFVAFGSACHAPCPRVRSLAPHVKMRCVAPVPTRISAPRLPTRTCEATDTCVHDWRHSKHAGPLCIGVLRLRAGAVASVPLHKRATVYALVLRGRVALSLSARAGTPSPTHVLDRFQALRVPHGHFRLRADATPSAPGAARVATAKVLLIAVDAPPSAPDPLARSSAAPVDLTALPDLAWGKGLFRARIGLQSPASPEASLGALIARADASIPVHVHAREWEHLVVLSGGGTLLTPTMAPHERNVRPGDVLHIPPGVPHGFRGDGARDLVGLQLYTPPGPEQRFRKLAAPNP